MPVHLSAHNLPPYYNSGMETSVDSNGIELVSMAAIEDEVSDYLVLKNIII